MATARSSARGSSLIELALVLPVLLMLVLNALNFGYFILVALNLTSASRSATEYSITGQATPATIPLPPPTPGSTLSCPSYNPDCWVTETAYTDLKVGSPRTSTLQVCSETVGMSFDASGNPVACCSKGSNLTFTGGLDKSGSCSLQAAEADPEGPHFVLQQVDVWYSFEPLIPGKVFNIATPCGLSNCQFHRRAFMRAMN